MNIAFVTTHLPPDDHYGGVVQCGDHLTRYLKVYADHCFVACVSRQPMSVLKRENRPDVCARSQLCHRWGFAPSLKRDLSALATSVNVCHVNGIVSYPATVASLICCKARVPMVVSAHGGLEPWRVAYKAWKKRPYLALIGRRVLARAACLHAITHLEIEGFRRVGYRGPVTVVPNGIEPGDFTTLPGGSVAEQKWPHTRGRKVVLFLSRIDYEKGLDQLIAAWASIRVKHPAALLVLAGPDNRGYLTRVRHLVSDKGVGSSILMPGMLVGMTRRAMLGRADMFVLPSYSEGFSVALLEALACGKPAVITPGCNFPEVAKVGAGLEVWPESGPLAEAISYVLGLSDDQRRTMGLRGCDLVRKAYTWEIAARKMITVYKCILEGREIPLYPEPADV